MLYSHEIKNLIMIKIIKRIELKYQSKISAEFVELHN